MLWSRELWRVSSVTVSYARLGLHDIVAFREPTLLLRLERDATRERVLVPEVVISVNRASSC